MISRPWRSSAWARSTIGPRTAYSVSRTAGARSDNVSSMVEGSLERSRHIPHRAPGPDSPRRRRSVHGGEELLDAVGGPRHRVLQLVELLGGEPEGGGAVADLPQPRLLQRRRGGD